LAFPEIHAIKLVLLPLVQERQLALLVVRTKAGHSFDFETRCFWRKSGNEENYKHERKGIS
jgi:hypothetical protein